MVKQMKAIYAINNIRNEKKYIGSSVRTDSRVKHHLCALGKGTHQNSRLQDDFNRFGRECFEVYVLEEVFDSGLLLERELFWINFFDTLSTGYNILLPGEVPPNLFYCKGPRKRKKKVLVDFGEKEEEARRIVLRLKTSRKGIRQGPRTRSYCTYKEWDKKYNQ
jgi:group I intron endonuclease